MEIGFKNSSKRCKRKLADVHLMEYYKSLDPIG